MTKEPRVFTIKELFFYGTYMLCCLITYISESIKLYIKEKVTAKFEKKKNKKE